MPCASLKSDKRVLLLTLTCIDTRGPIHSQVTRILRHHHHHHLSLFFSHADKNHKRLGCLLSVQHLLTISELKCTYYVKEHYAPYVAYLHICIMHERYVTGLSFVVSLNNTPRYHYNSLVIPPPHHEWVVYLINTSHKAGIPSLYPTKHHHHHHHHRPTPCTHLLPTRP